MKGCSLRAINAAALCTALLTVCLKSSNSRNPLCLSSLFQTSDADRPNARCSAQSCTPGSVPLPAAQTALGAAGVQPLPCMAAGPSLHCSASCPHDALRTRGRCKRSLTVCVHWAHRAQEEKTKGFPANPPAYTSHSPAALAHVVCSSTAQGSCSNTLVSTSIYIPGTFSEFSPNLWQKAQQLSRAEQSPCSAPFWPRRGQHPQTDPRHPALPSTGDVWEILPCIGGPFPAGRLRAFSSCSAVSEQLILIYITVLHIFNSLRI